MCKGFTLIEAIIVLAIIAIISGVAVPSVGRMIERNQASLAMNWILSAVRFTRDSAVTHNTLTTLCPSSTGTKCGGKWHDGVLVFTDANADRVVNHEDAILLQLPYPYAGSTIKWRSFRNRQFLQINSLGYTNFQNGNFTYCASSQDPQFSRQIVINMQGRVRKSYDRNNDGLIEDRYNKPLRC